MGLVGLAVVGVCASKRAAATCASVRLCIAIDGSGSISSSNFNLIKTGLANAISDSSIVPQDGSVEISFVQFGSSVATHVAPTVIDSQAAANSVASVLNSIPKDDGSTKMSLAISTCSSLITGSCGSSRQVINVVTDGTPDSQTNTIAARNAAIAAGIDEINAEAVAAPTVAFTFLRDQLVHPQPGIEAPPFTSPGFVIRTDTFADFAQAVRGKIGSIVGPQECFIDPPAATNPLGATHFFNVSVTNTDGTPAIGASVHVEVISGPNTGVSGNFTTDANGELTGLNYADSNGGGRDTIEVSGTSGGTPFSCTATKFWGDPPPPCTVHPASDTNPVETDHTVTATFTTADGLPAVDVPVSVSISSGPNQLFADAVTNANGQVPLTYTGGATPGTDIIEFAGIVDGEIVRCTASKTWVIVPPTCNIQPPAAVNLTGTQHSVTVSVNHSDGTPAAGAHFDLEIISGPNAGASGSGSTGAGGTAQASYTGTGGAGTDAIEVSGTLDGQPFSCSASKTWENPPPPCTVNPPAATNLVGSQHTVTATFKRGDGSFATGVHVAIDTSGANPQPQQTRTTNAGGLVSWTYTGTHAGLDTIEFSGEVDGHPVSCSASKTWELLPPPCLVDPPSGTNAIGSEHTVTATFKRGDGSRAPGVDVSISVSGPNAPSSGQRTTDADGKVQWSYTGQNAGTDTIEFSGTVDGHEVTCSATKTWEIPPPPCSVSPASATNPIGHAHVVTATFRRADGSPAAGVDVMITTSGVNPPASANDVTGAGGQVPWSYTGEVAGTDTIEFRGMVDGHEVTCSATKTWVVPQPACNAVPASAVNRVGTEHFVTATFTRADGSAAIEVPVSITISGVSPTVFADAETTAGGQVSPPPYTSESAGDDHIEFTGVVDGRIVSCSATKTWVVSQPTCEATPATAVNPVGTEHVVTAIFRKADGSPAAGVDVAISTSGANPAAFGHGITTAGGQVTFPYTGTETGTDVIEFGGVVDGQLVRCSASKTWVPARPSCNIFPATAVNRVGSTHVVGAVFRNGDGSPAAGAGVAISISGANGPILVDNSADASGLATWGYKGLYAGTDVIEFSAFIDGERVACQATKTWVGAQPTCSLIPTTAVNPVGSQHTVTAVFSRADGSPAAGVPTAISISGASGTTLVDGMTDASGQFPWSYRGQKPGTDVIEFTAFVDGRVVSCRGTKTWVAGQPTCDAVPATAVNPVGSRHTVTAFFRRGDGSLAAGVRVAIGVAGPPVPDFDPGPNPGGLGLIPFIFRSDVTGGRGELEFSYSSDRPGTDTIEFSGFVDGRLVTCRAAKTWVAGQPTCELTPATAVNRVGTQHVVTGTFRRADGSPAAGVAVSISTSGAGPAVLADGFTNANGQVPWPYTGRNPGTDIIEMRAFIDGQIVACRAAKTWIPAEPTCDVVPGRAVNPVNSQHTVTATFRRSDGSLAAGVPVAINISGATPLTLADGVTDASGQLPWSYSGPNPGTDFIDFTAFLEGRIVSCRAIKTWVAVRRPTCAAVPAAAVNVVGDSHAVTATFRRGDGSLATGVPTSITITGPNPALIDAVTTAGGRVSWPYRGTGGPGTDVITFTAVIDGQTVTCRSTKTWVARQGSCRIFPSSDVNPTGTQHAVRGTFRRGDGSPAAGVNVTMRVASGPNAGLITSGVTDAAGLVAPPPYTGRPQGGTDVIEFSGRVDGQIVTCNATKTWVAAQPTCDAAPSGVANPVGSRHTVTAIFRRGNGAPAAGAAVAIAITGPNRNLVNTTADANGRVPWSYLGSGGAGTDVIDFSAVVDGQPVTCRATKIWTAARPSCTASPVTAVNPGGTRHTVTAVFRRGNGAPAAGVPVIIRIAGPNPAQVNDVTSAGGQVVRAYTGGAAAGTDVIDFSAVVDGQPVSCRALKTWTAAQATCAVSPASMTNPAGTRHAVTATFRRGDGSLAAGVPVQIRVSGVSPLQQANDTTNTIGEVPFSYVGASQPGTDVIEFSGTVDGQVVTCRGSKTWTAPQPRCEALPAAAVKRVSTFHAVTAIFRRGDGSPVAAVPVTIGITSGPNAALPKRNKLTNAGGEARLGYIGTTAGSDVVEFSGVVGGQLVRCQADTTWTLAQPACDAVPATTTKAAGSTHTVTASFTRADGSPAPGVKVTVGIASGPDSPLSASNTTDGAGEVPFSYTSGAQAGTDVIEFSGFVGGQEVRCSASMTVAAARATCDAVPATAPDDGSREHTVTATFRRGDGSPAAAVDVAVRVTNASMVPILNNIVTDSGGRAPFTYTGGALAGTDTIEFTGVVDGQAVSCSATKKWDGAKPSCTADPPKDVNPLGTLHVVTATFKRSDGSPAAGVEVAIGISSGPNSALLNNKTTDAAGQAAFSYLGSAEGTDVIEFSGVVEGQTVRCTATKTWGTTPPGCDAVPTSSVSPLGMEHSVTAIFRRADGSPAAGLDVKADITAGPTSPLSRNLTTNANGQARLAYSGSAGGTDTIEFSGTVDGQAVTCSANQTWAGGVAPTSTATVTPTAAPTATGTLPTATATATATPLADCSCVGDCDCGGEVTVNEIVTMVNIALGVRGGEACPAGDANGLDGVTVNEIILAVNNALFGCPLQAPAR